jgi:hypothetical protein
MIEMNIIVMGFWGFGVLGAEHRVGDWPVHRQHALACAAAVCAAGLGLAARLAGRPS